MKILVVKKIFAFFFSNKKFGLILFRMGKTLKHRFNFRKPRVTANIVAQQIASSFPTVPGQPAPPKLQKSNQSTKKNLKKK